jgi:hypothetical protein
MTAVTRITLRSSSHGARQAGADDQRRIEGIRHAKPEAMPEALAGRKA